MAKLWELQALQPNARIDRPPSFKCRFTIRVWNALKDWLGLFDMEPMDWQAFNNVQEWWV
jgi:hypothetical protein